MRAAQPGNGSRYERYCAPAQCGVPRLKIDAEIVSNGVNARIRSVSEMRLAINNRVVESGVETEVHHEDKITLGEGTIRWQSAPKYRGLSPGGPSEVQLPGAWVWLTNRIGTALVKDQRRREINVNAKKPCPDGAHVHVFAGTDSEFIEKLESRKSRDSSFVWRIGSAPDCHVRLDASGVSGLHAFLANNAGQWCIIDEISANGVYVNGRKSQKSYLSSGDVIQIAESPLVIHFPATPPELRSSWLRKLPLRAIAKGIVAACLFALLLVLIGRILRSRI